MQYERVLIVVEGLYSMDGDMPDLPHFVEIKRRHRASLCRRSAFARRSRPQCRGIQEHFGLVCSDVDIWMVTQQSARKLRGYVAANARIVEHLKCAAPASSTVSVCRRQPPPPRLAALRLLHAEPHGSHALQMRGRQFWRWHARSS